MILGITPARGGSKAIPRKNIKEIYGKPLIAWTIESALKSKLLDKYLVSTEDKKIAEVAGKYGAEVIDRPMEFALDKATTFSLLKNDILKKINADIVVLLQCTSPVRDKGLIDKCIQRFLDAEADSLATGYYCKLFEWGTYSDNRQDFKGFFHDDGNIIIMKSENIKKAEKLEDVWGEKMEKVEVSKKHNFEIDDEFDFWLNEQILKKRYEDK